MTGFSGSGFPPSQVVDTRASPATRPATTLATTGAALTTAGAALATTGAALSKSWRRLDADPFASFELDALLTGAAQLRPDRLALSCASCAALSFAQLDARASTMAAHLAAAGLQAGERIVIAGAARAASVLTLLGGVRAGLDVAMAPLHLDAKTLAAFARDVGAVALAAEARHGDVDCIETLFGAAAGATSVRVVISLGGGDADGAIELDPQRLEPRAAPARRGAAQRAAVLTREGDSVRRWEQQALVSAALEVMSRARIGMRDPIISTLAPVRFGALAAGPFTALLAGCALHLHAPFDAEAFLAEFDAHAPAHLVVPAALAQALAAGGGMQGGRVASLMVSGKPHAYVGIEDVPVIDIDALAPLAKYQAPPIL